jgi:hypothetical protein
MGISISDFWDMTPRDLLNAIDGYTSQELEQDLQNWKRVRWQTWVLVTLKDKQTDRIKKPGDLLPLEEEEIAVQAKTLAKTDPIQAEKIAAKWDAFMAAKHQKTVTANG